MVKLLMPCGIKRRNAVYQEKEEPWIRRSLLTGNLGARMDISGDMQVSSFLTPGLAGLD